MSKSNEKLLAIIAETSIQPNKEQDASVLTLWLLGVSDQYRSRKIRKSYYYKDVPPPALCRDFLTLGVRVKSVEEIPALAEQLIGRIVRMSIVPDENGRQRFYIDEYVGSDDPGRYDPQNDRVQE